MRKRKRTLKRRSTSEKIEIVSEYRQAPMGEKVRVLVLHEVSRQMVLRWMRGECLGDPGRPKVKK